MYYKILEKDFNGLTMSESLRVSRLKMSHLLIGITGTAIKATELPKMSMNAYLIGKNNSVKNIITNVPLSTLAEYTDMSGGVGYNSTTNAYIKLPIGTLDLSAMDLMLEFKGSSAFAANALQFNMYACRQDDALPIVEYQYRSMPTDGTTLPDVLAVYDTSTAVNSTVSTVLTFPDNSQVTIPHKMGFVDCQASNKLETQNAFGLIFLDKDIPRSKGRTLKIEPSTAFNAFVVQYSSTLNAA